MKVFVLELLTRHGCHLCEEAEPITERVARLVGAELRVVDIDQDAEMAVDWDLRVPVVRGPSGDVLDEGNISFWALLLAAVRARLS